MADASHPTSATVPARYSMPADPIRKLGAAISAFFAGEAETPARMARSVDVELRPAPGGDLQIEMDGDAITIRGAVLTIRGAGSLTLPEPQKYYF